MMEPRVSQLEKATESAAGRNRFLRFLVAGSIAAAINFVTRIVFSRSMPFALAIVLAYLCGLITAFLLNRRYVFTDASNGLHRQMFWFIAINVLALAQTLVVSLALAHYVFPTLGFDWHSEEVAHAIGIVIPIYSSYVGHKRLSFRTRA